MMARTQLTIERELLKKAKRRAAELGVSLAEYVRSLVAKDLAQPAPPTDASAVFDLGDSGGSDVARQKDRYMGEAVASDRAR
jgi:hypothetical protein